MIIARPLAPHEPDLLLGNEHKTLCFFTESDPQKTVCIEPPKGGWTHTNLEAVIPPEDVWDAYLGHQWIGSSEV